MSKAKVGRRAIELKLQHSIEELKEHYRRCTCAVERRRTQVIWWLAQGLEREQVLELSAYSQPQFGVSEAERKYLLHVE